MLAQPLQPSQRAKKRNIMKEVARHGTAAVKQLQKAAVPTIAKGLLALEGAVPKFVSDRAGYSTLTARQAPSMSSPGFAKPPEELVVHESKRSIVTSSLIRDIGKTPLIQTVMGEYRIQEPYMCFENSAGVRDGIAKKLEATGHLVRDGKAGTAAYTGELSGSALVKLNNEHGPLMIATYNMLSPEDGAERYTTRHAAVLAGSFQTAKGESVGLVVDGNNFQSNKPMEAIKRWMDKNGDDRPLSALTEEDFEKINEDLREQGESTLDVRQISVRLVDLDRLLAASDEGFKTADPLSSIATEVRYEPSATVKKELLPAKVVAALEAAIIDDHSIIEKFDR
jgi:hypothetical protein